MCWASELLKTLVFEYRIVSYEFFMREMGVAEAYYCMENLKWTDLNFKAMMRFAIWNMYNSSGLYKNTNAVEDIMKLPWDEDNTKHVVLSKKQLEVQNEKMKRMEEMMRNGKQKVEKYM